MTDIDKRGGAVGEVVAAPHEAKRNDDLADTLATVTRVYERSTRQTNSRQGPRPYTERDLIGDLRDMGSSYASQVAWQLKMQRTVDRDRVDVWRMGDAPEETTWDQARAALDDLIVSFPEAIEVSELPQPRFPSRDDRVDRQIRLNLPALSPLRYGQRLVDRFEETYARLAPTSDQVYGEKENEAVPRYVNMMLHNYPQRAVSPAPSVT